MYAPSGYSLSFLRSSPLYSRPSSLTPPFSYHVDEQSTELIPALFVSRATFLVLRDELEISSEGVKIQLSQEDGWEWSVFNFPITLVSW